MVYAFPLGLFLQVCFQMYILVTGFTSQDLFLWIERVAFFSVLFFWLLLTYLLRLLTKNTTSELVFLLLVDHFVGFFVVECQYYLVTE